MASRIDEDSKDRLNRLASEFSVKIENSINGFKVLGLNNGTEPRANTLKEAIILAEDICFKIYKKYL